MNAKRNILLVAIVLFLGIGVGTSSARAEPVGPPIEVFDVKEERVVNAIPMTKPLHDRFAKLLAASPSMYGGMSMNPKTGYVVRVRFPVPLSVRDPLYPEKIKEAFVFLEKGAQPKALVFFQGERRPIVVVLEESPEALIEAVQPER